jgi:hypothetical protein
VQAFVTRLRAAFAHALARAKTVTGYPGYNAVLGEFANSLGDGYIWSGPRYSPAALEWTGIVFRPASIEWVGLVIAKRQSRWVIAKEDPSVVRERLEGARLSDCGGMAIADFARGTLGSYPGIVCLS